MTGLLIERHDNEVWSTMNGGTILFSLEDWPSPLEKLIVDAICEAINDTTEIDKAALHLKIDYLIKNAI